MGSRAPAEARAARVATTALALSLLAGSARADPILELPPVGKGSLLGSRNDGAPRGAPGLRRRSAAAAGSSDPDRLPGRTGWSELALIAEMSALAVLGAERTTIHPDVGTLRGGQPELAVMRVGLVGWSGCRPFGFALIADLAEGLRLESSEARARPAVAVDQVIDDAHVTWTPRPWTQVTLGRLPVPFSRFRQGEHATLTGGATPFVVDRIAPDRRWGGAFHGDVGAIGYAAGAYADLDRLERRPVPPQEPDPDEPPSGDTLPDPSTGGRAILAGRAEWTPRAPIGPGAAPSPRTDPWFSTPRWSAGAGVAWRWREPGTGSRVDLSLSGLGKASAWSALVELFLSIDGGTVALAGAAEAGFLPSDRVLLFARGDYDIEVDWWTAGGGATYFVTRDRWNKVSIFGWARREGDDVGPDADGVIVELGASL